MERFKQILKKLFYPPPAFIVPVALPSFILVIYVLAAELEDSYISYIAYVLSAYSLVITVTCMINIVQSVCKGIKKYPLVRKMLAHPVGDRFFHDKLFRAEILLYPGLAINLLYVAVKLFSGIYYHSVWFITLSVYYMFLSAMRFLLLNHVKRSPAGQEYVSELKSYRLCGVILLIMNLALSGIVTLVVVRNKGFEYGGYLIYVMAMYTFYITIISIINVIRFRKYNSPVLSAAKTVNLTAALISVLSLETAMLSQFGDAEDSAYRQTMTAVTGFVICIFVFGMAVFMIIRSTKQLRKIQIKNSKAYNRKENMEDGRQKGNL